MNPEAYFLWSVIGPRESKFCAKRLRLTLILPRFGLFSCTRSCDVDFYPDHTRANRRRARSRSGLRFGSFARAASAALEPRWHLQRVAQAESGRLSRLLLHAADDVVAEVYWACR